MANVKISALPSYTGTAADLRWFVMNNSGETSTFKYSGYSTSITYGTGTDSIASTNATASGTNAVAIGNGAIADGNNSVNIGNSTIPIGASSVCIGKHYNSGISSINIGGGAYNYGSYGIAIGYETSSQNGGIAIGSNTTRANGSNSVSLGHAIERNNGINSVVIGYDNSAGLPGIFNGNPYGVIIGSGHRAETTGFYNTILGGYGNYITGTTSGATLIGCSGVTSVGSNDVVVGIGNTTYQSGYYNIVLGRNNSITGGNTHSIFGGQSNTISSTGTHNFIGGGQGNTLGANTTQTSLTAGYNNNIQATILGFIGGTQDNTVTSAGYTYVLVGGGYNTVNATNASAGNAMYSSYFCSDSTINDGSVIGSSNNWFSGSRNGTMSGYGKHNHISNSYSSTITNNGGSDVYEWFNKIDSSSGSTITTSKQSQILGGVDNTISGKTRVVMIGTSGRTASADNTTYVENLHTYRTPSTQVQPVSSGTTFTCNLDNGGKAQYYITGTSTVNITNVRDGASFMIKTQTTGNYNMTWTATGGYTFVFEGGIKDPGNNVTDIFVFEVFGSVIYGNRRHNYS